MRFAALLCAAGPLLAAGCKSMTHTETGAAVGAGMGTVVGTALGAATGNPRTGAVIGAMGGTIVGGAVGASEDRRERDEAVAQARFENEAAQSRLGITDVVTLVQQNVDAQVIVNQIRSTGSTYNLSTSDIQYLTQQNVPPTVITAMQNARPGAQRVIVREPGPVIIERPWCHHPWHCGPRFGFHIIHRH